MDEISGVGHDALDGYDEELAAIAAFRRRKHGSRALASHLRRPYLEHPSSLLALPTVGLGVLALKGDEAAAVVGRLLLGRRPTT